MPLFFTLFFLYVDPDTVCKVHSLPESGEVEPAGKKKGFPTTGPLINLGMKPVPVNRQSRHFSSANLLSSSCIVSVFIYGSGDGY